MNWPKVSIVVTSYWEKSKGYLDLAMESIANLSYPKDKLEIILVTKPSYRPEYPNCKTVFPDKEKFYNPTGINYGIAQSTGDFIFLINDDVILTKGCIEPLVTQAMHNDCILMPLLSCHQMWRYNLMIGYQDGDLFYPITKRFHRLHEWLPIKDKLMNAESVYYPGGILHEPYLCMVASMIPRKTWDKLGGFDETFTVGQDDVDFSKKAKKMGTHLGILLNSLVWHFGGATTEDSSKELRQESIDIYKKKWNEEPP